MGPDKIIFWLEGGIAYWVLPKYATDFGQWLTSIGLKLQYIKMFSHLVGCVQDYCFRGVGFSSASGLTAAIPMFHENMNRPNSFKGKIECVRK